MEKEKRYWFPVLRYIGVALFVLSFFVPSRWRTGESFEFFGGAQAFVSTPITACEIVMANKEAVPEHAIRLFILMMGAWLSNITIFTRMPRAIALAAILAPWAAYVFLFEILAGFLPFYPWAIGIALIHISRWPKPVYGDPSLELQQMAPKG